MARKEKDLIGEIEIDKDEYIGIHTTRAMQNFEISGYKINGKFIKAYGLVKLSAMQSVLPFVDWNVDKQNAIIDACREMSEGKLSQYIKVDALQGGAGTSLNMNVNEVIANRALEILGEEKGNYKIIHPIEDINLFQSTNDTYPTALKIACINLLKELEFEITKLEEAFENKEKEFADIVKIGRTQLQDAVLTTLGKTFSSYSEAISRDRWRVYKCEERLRVVNIGATAIGTGIGAKRKYIFDVIEKLRSNTGLGLARAENLIENTQNADVFAEVSGILKAFATNLIKISNDLRLLSSNSGFNEIKLPPVQAGSSIMAGKVNPVICEMTAQAGMKVLGNDVVINQCVASGHLELNQFMPLIAFSILESLELLKNTVKIFNKKCVSGIEANKESIQEKLENSDAILTAFLPKLGYEKVSEISKQCKTLAITPIEYIEQNKLLTKDEIEHLTSSDAILALGER